MPVIEISMKPTKAGSVIKMRERRGRNWRTRWRTATIKDQAKATATWLAIQNAASNIIAAAKVGEVPAMLVSTGPRKDKDVYGELFDRMEG